MRGPDSLSNSLQITEASTLLSSSTKVSSLVKVNMVHQFLTSLVELLESVLFANIRFHDTTSRGRLLNRFGKDFEGNYYSTYPNPSLRLLSMYQTGIDSSLPDDFGETVIHAIALIVTFATMTYIGGLPFVAVALGFIFIMYKGEYLLLSFTDNSILIATCA